jgi:hypothetical protein
MDSADFNVSKILLFLIELQKLAELWPNTRRISGELGQICTAIWIPVNFFEASLCKIPPPL